MDILMNIAIVTIISLAISVALGPIVIPMLTRLKVGQSIREDGPQSHLKKSGTPTMGGVMMVIASIVAIVLTGNTEGTGMLFLSMIGFGLIGFVDDFIKVVLKRSLGLRAYQKLVGQFAIAIGMSFYILNTSQYGSEVLIPFSDSMLDLGILFVPFLTIVMVATVNSANLTDGLDGLASSVTAVMLMAFMLIAISFGNTSVALFSAAVMGACIGFLKHNSYPAKVFMGDTGSMALGGAVSAVAVSLNATLLIPIICGIYFIEALSVIIQVISFKTRGKRVFKMSPIHHHYEHKGWSETKVVVSFLLFTIAVSMIGYLSVVS